MITEAEERERNAGLARIATSSEYKKHFLPSVGERMEQFIDSLIEKDNPEVRGRVKAYRELIMFMDNAIQLTRENT